MARRVFTQTFGVVAALVVKNGRVLLVREIQIKRFDDGLGDQHQKLGPDHNKWNHPAGWIEVGENPLDGVKREVLEETGYNFEPTNILGVYSLVRKDIAPAVGATPHPIKLAYIGEISENSVAELQDDVSEIGWFTPEEIYKMGIDELRDIDIKQMTADYFAGRRYPLELIRHITQNKN